MGDLFFWLGVGAARKVLRRSPLSLGSFVDRRYSGCSVDCWRNGFPLGQPSMKAYANPQPWISHRRVVITDPFLASWDARLGVEPV